MIIEVYRIFPNASDTEHKFIEATVHFWEDEEPPYRSAEVTVHIEKSARSSSLVDIESQAIIKAREFLLIAAKAGQ